MDPRHFDIFARSLVAEPSRRRFLMGLFGGLLATVPASRADPVMAGKKKRRKKRKKRKRRRKRKRRSQRCGRKACKKHFNSRPNRDYCEFICQQCDEADPREFCIVDFGGELVAACCTEGAECCGGHGGVCCGGLGDPERQCCNGECVNTRTDPNHCGACNTPCAANESCIDGECIFTGAGCDGATPPWCNDPGRRMCVGNCVNILSSPSHCGACCQPCPDGQICCNGTCVDYKSNPNHCGGCFDVCDPGETCQDGWCWPA